MKWGGRSTIRLVMELRVVVACSECGVYWFLDREQAKCNEPQHLHQQFEVHHHCSVVTLPDRTEVTAASFGASDPYTRDCPPDYGIYLDPLWQPPWNHDNLDWPDFGVPVDPSQVVVALQSVLARVRAGQRVEIGCRGGHGRTGTALACLAVFSGIPPSEAVEWVRSNYCAEAIETAEQEEFIAGLGE